MQDYIDISSKWNIENKNKLTFVDLFSGAGGLTKGFELAGFEGICGLDWFKEATETYDYNFSHNIVNGNIRDKDVKELFYNIVNTNLNGRTLDIVAGGFPCQGFSMAGNRVVDDERNSLYKELLEIVVVLQPKYVVCENVKGILSMLGGKVVEKIVEDFKEIGYDMNFKLLNAANYYVPQKRERVIFIGNRIGKENKFPKPILNESEYITVEQAISDLVDKDEHYLPNHIFTQHKPDMVEKMNELPEGKSLYKGYSDAWKRIYWNKPSNTIKENHGGVNIHPKLNRCLTPREMARLQSFPDDFIFKGSKTKQLVQLGNAVPPLLAKAIGLALCEM